jgi:hypothetical protein
MAQSDWLFNGKMVLPPTEGRWLSRSPIDVSGENRPLYGPVRMFELRWELSYYSQWALLQSIFNEVIATGTLTARLPTFPITPYPGSTGAAYGFTEYSGCVLAEPSIGSFFEGYPSDVTVLIGNIVTG